MDEKLEQVLHKVELLCEQYPEFKEKLLVGFDNTQHNFIPTEEHIDAIYEYCIEEILCRQSKEFYKFFPLSDIIPTLEQDYIRMEMFHRDDNFEDFCLAAYQQVECICKQVSRNEYLQKIANKLMGYSAWAEEGEYKDNRYYPINSISAGTRKNSSYRVADLIFPGRDEGGLSYAVIKSDIPLIKQNANDLIRIVIYFICFQSALRNKDFDTYVLLCDTLGKQLYQCRNLNHRGGEPTDWQKGIIEPVMEHKAFYYYKFISALTQFVELFQLGYPKLSSIYNQISSLSDIEVREKIEGLKMVNMSAEEKLRLQRNMQISKKWKK